jgi:hypothetical protein
MPNYISKLHVSRIVFAGVSELQEKRLELIVQGRGWNNDEGRALNVPAFVVHSTLHLSA